MICEEEGGVSFLRLGEWWVLVGAGGGGGGCDGWEVVKGFEMQDAVCVRMCLLGYIVPS